MRSWFHHLFDQAFLSWRLLCKRYAGFAPKTLIVPLAVFLLISANVRAIEVVLGEGPRTPDMGGEATTVRSGKQRVVGICTIDCCSQSREAVNENC